jgi:hypothetical protein
MFTPETFSELGVEVPIMLVADTLAMMSSPSTKLNGDALSVDRLTVQL